MDGRVSEARSVMDGRGTAAARHGATGRRDAVRTLLLLLLSGESSSCARAGGSLEKFSMASPWGK